MEGNEQCPDHKQTEERCLSNQGQYGIGIHCRQTNMNWTHFVPKIKARALTMYGQLVKLLLTCKYDALTFFNLNEIFRS